MRSIVIISEFPMHRDALKSIVKELTPLKVFVCSDLACGVRRAVQFAPSLVLVDNSQIRPREIERFWQHADRYIKVVLIDWEENKMVVYSRTALFEATLQNLNDVIKSAIGSDLSETSNTGNARLRKGITKE